MDVVNQSDSSVEDSLENKISKEIGLIRYVLNWKYYLIAIIVAILTTKIASLGGISFIIAIFAASRFKKRTSNKKEKLLLIVYKVAVIFLVGILTFIVMLTTRITLDKFVEAFLSNNTQREVIINKSLEANKKLPVMLNEHIQLVKYSSNNYESITMHIKYINFTKNEVLAEYANDKNQFEAEILADELKTSCVDTNIRNMLSTGLDFNIEYLGKRDQVIAQITLNKENCQINSN
jgi:hypothetical protein